MPHSFPICFAFSDDRVFQTHCAIRSLRKIRSKIRSHPIVFAIKSVTVIVNFSFLRGDMENLGKRDRRYESNEQEKAA